MVTTRNIIIDSGTTFTFLESGFYEKFGAAVEASVTGAKCASDPQGMLTHCFKARDKKDWFAIDNSAFHGG
ncbi:hypothetical protein BRARA_I03858 [Brassica rapa]|uniref:Xylanase inhibitor C-terminal domain-containing protein n=1 Tax=Brassica campestris TaxID=3711 RepID=A0A397Y684_BRACM|nr:hypothetical protein BRARA_I03858 [Brassica rapa]